MAWDKESLIKSTEESFSLELPENEERSTTSKVARVIGTIVSVLAGIGLILLSIPFIVCGGGIIGILILGGGIAAIYFGVRISKKKK